MSVDLNLKNSLLTSVVETMPSDVNSCLFHAASKEEEMIGSRAA